MVSFSRTPRKQEIQNTLQIIAQGKIIEATDLEEIAEGMVDKIKEKITGMKGMIVTIEIGTGQGKELLQLKELW